MAFQYLSNVSLEQAIPEYLQVLKEQGLDRKTENISVLGAAGRITAKPVYANICAPHYHACAMDGIALEAKLTFGASETTPVFLDEAQFVRVDTGDPLPKNCDAVVMIEYVIEDEGGIKLFMPATPWQHVRQIGEDICVGDMLLTSYALITPAATGAMLASGILQVEVIKKPLVGIIPTGDEIVPPSENPAEGDIIEFNSTIFSGMLKEWGADIKTYPVIKDKQKLIENAIREAAEDCDVVILNAGSSAGREDFAKASISSVGKVLYHGIAIRPGKPSILGYVGPTPVLGVPGYPVSAILVLEYILRPIIDLLCGRKGNESNLAEARLTSNFNSSLKYREFVRARLGSVNKQLIAVPLQRGAGVVSSLVKADGIIDVPQDVEGYKAGDVVQVQLLKPLAEIEKMLVITGSHDPLIDELAELMRQKWIDTEIASSHVGSMGGIFAIKRGEAHLAGVHLLDEESGAYNIPYLKRYFPQDGIILVECVKRIQGLMIAKGNPKGIKEISDLLKPGMRYVNRQKGSGTRILFDYMCKQEALDTSKIYGYGREEFTHTAVAAQIASDSADAGLGIYSAAQIYDLDFVPICTEQYDLLINKKAFGLDSVQRLLEILRSEAFKDRMMKMGGYEVTSPGRVIYGLQ